MTRILYCSRFKDNLSIWDEASSSLPPSELAKHRSLGIICETLHIKPGSVVRFDFDSGAKF